mmetsp:Transcript_166442/g.534710  ORF Transcript_166442/g.534710 Transcript_166442/m.534710 type:complete len:274 (-) Transcript_166442:145-966(-)
MADVGGEAAALRARLEELLPLVGKAEKALESQQREHEELLDAITAADVTRTSLASALEGASGDAGPLTDAAVRRASQAVAVLFAWARTQLEVAPFIGKLEAAAAPAPALEGHLLAAEAARARLAALSLNKRLQEVLQRSNLSSRVAMVGAIHSSESGAAGIDGLQGVEALLAELQVRKSELGVEMTATKGKLQEASQEVVQLEVKLEDAKMVYSGPPFCECGDEMVYREVCNLADPNWGRKFWKCPRRLGGCTKRIWDDSAAVTSIENARVGG